MTQITPVDRAVASCDIHMHTLYSDGLLTPEALARRAARLGLTTIAITDHDNTRGSREVRPIARELGIQLITGIEFNTRWDGYGSFQWGGMVDLLAYFFDPDNPSLAALEQGMMSEYRSQIAEAVEWMRGQGYPLTWEEVEASHPAYPCIFDMLDVLKAKGCSQDEDSMWAKIMESWNRVCKLKFPISRVIDVVHAAGGITVLAHPSAVYRLDGSWITENDLAELVEMGLDGIEIYHYRLPDEATRQYFLTLARRFDLAISGGSDEHARPDGCYRLGQQPITEEIVSNLRARSKAHL